MMELHDMGHNAIPLDVLICYLKKCSQFNIKIIKYLTDYNIELQNNLNNNSNKKFFPSKLIHQKFFSYIKQNNLFLNYNQQNHQIIHNLISQDSHLKKKSKKYLNQEKKKINKAIASETLRHMVEFEIK